MKKGRDLVIQAVLEGKLDAEHLTKKEIDRVHEQVVYEVIEKQMQALLAEGKWVIWDDDPSLH